MNPDSPFFDLQVNGFAGVDFQNDDLSAASLRHAMEALLHHRTGRILLTLITDTIDRLCTRLERIESLRKDCPLASRVIAGYHLEGPWLLPEPGFHGAHNPRLMLSPSRSDLERLWLASGERLKLITLAPELPGAAEVISLATSLGIRTSIGHSNAGFPEIDAAIAAGLTLCTHLGNGIPALIHRHDNIVQRLLSRDELTAVFIPDGIHLPPTVLKNFVRIKPPGKVIFTTDCMSAAGARPGRYTLAHLEMEVAEDGIVREPGSQTFAGSSLTMDRAVANITGFLDWPLESAVAACSVDVARALSLSC
jgi:N-acetylglucosamine-6-phosphate deacetylase